MIAIIDYGMGNLRSVQKGLERVGFEAVVTRDVGQIQAARGVVLAGSRRVSAPAWRILASSGLSNRFAKSSGRKNRFSAFVSAFNCYFPRAKNSASRKVSIFFPVKSSAFMPNENLKVPHMGWNRIEKKKDSPFLEGIASGDYVYFVHSFYVVPRRHSIIATTTDYGSSFVSSIATDRLFACQFHPEKSQELGLRILANFGRFVKTIDHG